jgi:hypothetical protein
MPWYLQAFFWGDLSGARVYRPRMPIFPGTDQDVKLCSFTQSTTSLSFASAIEMHVSAQP